MGNGWTLFISNEFPEAYDYSGIGLSVTDYDADKPPKESVLPEKLSGLSAQQRKEVYAVVDALLKAF